MIKGQHIGETFQRLANGDWQMRKRYSVEGFADAIKDPEFLETYKRWMAGECDLSSLSARIDVKPSNPFAAVIIDHKNRTVGGYDWRARRLRDYDGPWQIHMDELAMEYMDAKNDGPLCHVIHQSISGLERHYYRLIIPKGDELLVFSSAFEGTMQ